MAIFRCSSGDGAGFSLLFSLVLLYGSMSFLAYSIIHMKFIQPLTSDSPLDRFSEGRAMEHLRVLSKDIDGRQIGRQGYRQAADYILGKLQSLKERANPNFRIEVEENTVNGSFNMMFLGHSISLGYRAHTNIVMRISSIHSLETDSSVLVNAHFDSPVGSPGAGDCGSCVASSLELARLITDSVWVPPRPIIFLFNGAEELFMLGSHGFMTTHKWRDTVGAFVNIEASGTGGPDVVCQSGPGSWPSFVYAKAAVYPMATSAAQDVFNVIPGDTDYRIFAKDYGDIPGLDIIFLLGGYFYHTALDTLERIVPGSIQARGDNLIRVVKTFAGSSMLYNASERVSLGSAAKASSDEGAIYFDYLTWFMVYYPKWLSRWLHSFPIVVFILAILFSVPKGLNSCCRVIFNLLQERPVVSTIRSYLSISCELKCHSVESAGLFLHAASIIMGIIIPAIFSVLRLAFTSHAMSWYAHPYSAFMMFIPCSLELADEAIFWGGFGFYATLTLVYVLLGLSIGFVTFFVTVSLLVAWLTHRLLKGHGTPSLRSLVIYILPLIPCLAYCVHFGGFLVQFLIEKMGMVGSPPSPYGFYIQDIIVAAVVGLATGWSVGPILPIISHWLARLSIIKFLLQVSVVMMAISSQLFPYNTEAPKRVVLQHTVITSDSTKILDSTYDFSVVDSNSLSFLFKNSPKAAEILFDSEVSFKSTREEWLPQEVSDIGSRRVYLELDLGSLKEVSVAVLNITGPLHKWSLVDVVPAPETIDGGPPSHICRLSGSSHEKWNFWLEANSSELLSVDLAVLDQHLVKKTRKLKDSFPDWVDVTAYTSFMSNYLF
ncbi:hypothetical protein V2J09_013199 [Rumex salicifolius]